MKTITTFFSILLTTSTLALASGNETSGGGSTTAARFPEVASRLLGLMNNFNYCETDNRFRTEPNCQWISVLETTLTRPIQVTAVGIITGPDGLPRDAGNNGIDSIEFNLEVWNSFATARPRRPLERAKLVIHEYAVLAGLERNDSYSVSLALVQSIQHARVSDLVFSLEEAPMTHEWFQGSNGSELLIEENGEFFVLNFSAINELRFCRSHGYLRAGTQMTKAFDPSLGIPRANLNSQNIPITGMPQSTSNQVYEAIYCTDPIEQ